MATLLKNFLAVLIIGFASACSSQENTGSDHPVVVLETELGDIRIEIYDQKAPLTAASFLDHVTEGHLTDGEFYRTVTYDNDNGSPRIEVIQGGIPMNAETPLPPIAHETTEMSGLKHLDGTVSLGRSEPGTASGAAFFICIGDQPGLDFGETRNPDKQGFAAFGQVIEGMDVVVAIHQAKTYVDHEDPYLAGQMLVAPVKILNAYRVDAGQR